MAVKHSRPWLHIDLEQIPAFQAALAINDWIVKDGIEILNVAGPRASQFLVLGAKARALLQGRFYVSAEDVRAIAHPVMRHRLVTSFAAEAEGINADTVIDRLLEEVKPNESEALADGKLPGIINQ